MSFEDVEKIEPGRTTYAEVRSVFGNTTNWLTGRDRWKGYVVTPAGSLCILTPGFVAAGTGGYTRYEYDWIKVVSGDTDVEKEITLKKKKYRGICDVYGSDEVLVCYGPGQVKAGLGDWPLPGDAALVDIVWYPKERRLVGADTADGGRKKVRAPTDEKWEEE